GLVPGGGPDGGAPGGAAGPRLRGGRGGGTGPAGGRPDTGATRRIPRQGTPAAAGFGRKVGSGVGWVRDRAAGGVTALRARRAETPAASRPRSGTQPSALRALPLALGMFTIAPLPASRTGREELDGGLGGWALRWLPVVGALLALLAWAGSLVFWRGHGGGATFVGAMVWIGLMALLTRGLHLDGLADVADGLGSRRSPEEALSIMRRSDVGPFGVAAVAGALLLQLGGVLTLMGAASRMQGLVLLLTVAATGRLAALDAARPTVPPARPGGFGALVAGTATATARAVAVAVTLVAGTLLLAATAVTFAQALWLPFAVLVGLAAGRAMSWHAVRRLDGVTGDVFGAAIEVTTTATLLALAAVVAWGGLLP
ncbi:adenosylcobinamide-GDP ribazoletransferase, partial [Frankia sp. CN7]|nr:adenosylcobinamide-GDP ribazoletransferase [Frankia nepalensis]